MVERPTALNPGDALSMGGVDIYFFPDQKQARRPVRTAASPGTLWLLTLFQVLMFLQFLPGLTAGASLPVCIGFGGLVLLSWVFCSLRRTGSPWAGDPGAAADHRGLRRHRRLRLPLLI